jgi:hypothetical protein
MQNTSSKYVPSTLSWRLPPRLSVEVGCARKVNSDALANERVANERCSCYGRRESSAGGCKRSTGTTAIPMPIKMQMQMQMQMQGSVVYYILSLGPIRSTGDEIGSRRKAFVQIETLPRINKTPASSNTDARTPSHLRRISLLLSILRDICTWREEC